MIWADRVGIAWAVIFYGFFGVLLGGFATADANDLIISGAKVVLPVWVLCRLIDFVSGGPARRALNRALSQAARSADCY